MKTKVVYYPANSTGRDFVVGDIHGCLEDLLKALKAVNFNEQTDRLFSVGDLIDRGPDSMGCAELVYMPWFHAVRGNHEQLMIDAVLNNDTASRSCWFGNGGGWSYNYSKQELRTMAEKLDELPYVIVVGTGANRFNIVHADLVCGECDISNSSIDEWVFSEEDETNMIWGRNVIAEPDCEWYVKGKLSITFVGHTPVTNVSQSQHQVFIDTGAVYFHTSGRQNERVRLTLACPTDGKIYSYSPLWGTVSSMHNIPSWPIIEEEEQCQK